MANSDGDGSGMGDGDGSGGNGVGSYYGDGVQRDLVVVLVRCGTWGYCYSDPMAAQADDSCVGDADDHSENYL